MTEGLTSVLETAQNMSIDVHEKHRSHVIAYLEGVLDGSLDVRSNYPPSTQAQPFLRVWAKGLHNGEVSLDDIEQALGSIEDMTLQMELWCIVQAAIESDPGFEDMFA